MKLKLSLTFAFLLATSVPSTSVPSTSALGMDDEAATLFQNGDGYTAFRIPALIQAANGDLLAFCEARAGGDASEISLVSRRSSDGGRTWDSLQVVQHSREFRSLFGEDAPPITVGNPAPVVDHLDPDHPGRIWLPFTLENDRVFVISSDDHGVTWSQRREITADVKLEEWGWYATGPVHSIQLRQGNYAGRLVVPCDHRVGADGKDDGACGAHAFFSDDHGVTWKLGAIDASYQDGVNANETAVVELNGGQLYFNTRDQKGPAIGTRAAARSNDGGVSFVDSDEVGKGPFAILGAPFDPPVVQCSLLRVKSRALGDAMDLILFSGPDESGPSGKGRSDLRIRYSLDEAQSWQDGPLIHVGPAAYSDMVVLDDQRIGVIFEAGKPGQKRYDRIDFRAIEIGQIVETQ